MGKSLAILLSLLLSSSSLVFSGTINLPPATLFGTGQQICNYRYAVPSGQDCVTSGLSLEHHLDVVQQDMDRIKLQYVSQNSVLLEELRKLRQQASTTDANLSDLTKDMKTLQDTIFNLQAQVSKNTNNNNNGNTNTNGVSNAMLQQLVRNTRSQLSQNMIQLQSQVNMALASVHSDLQRDSVQQSKVDTAFQQQLRQQQQDLTSVLQSLQQLQLRVTILQQQQQATTPLPPYTQPPVIVTTSTKKSPAPQQTTTAAATTASSSSSGPVVVTPDPQLLQQLQKDLQQLDFRVSSVEKEVQTDLPDLKKDLSHLQELVTNQTTEMSDVKLEVDYVEMNELPDLKSEIQKNYGAISQLTQTVQRDLPPLQAQVQKVAQNVTLLNQQILHLGTDFLTQEVQMHKDEQTLTDLETEVRLLASRLSRLIHDQHFTTAKPPSTRPPTTAAMHIPTPRPKNPQATMAIPTPHHG